MSQMGTWLTDGDVQRLVVVVTGIDSGETLERWQFNVCVDDGSDGVDVSVMAGNDENVSNNIAKRNGKGSDINSNSITKGGSKAVKEVHDEIQAIIRQITASVSRLEDDIARYFKHQHHASLVVYRIFSSSCRSLCYYQVTFLPLLNEPCSFDLLVYTNKTAVVPKKWEDSDPRYIMNSQEVKLRSFTTSVSFDMTCVVGFEYVTFNPTHARTLFHQ
jgi:hypothetical protein